MQESLSLTPAQGIATKAARFPLVGLLLKTGKIEDDFESETTSNSLVAFSFLALEMHWNVEDSEELGPVVHL